MTAAKHTPAPWFAHSDNQAVSAATITPGFGNTSNAAICSMRSNNPADAALIAAAPSMLNALLACISALECKGKGRNGRLLSALNQAKHEVSKATHQPKE